MKTVTVEQFRKFGPCWLETVEGRGKFARIAAIKNEWTALDVLALDGVSNDHKLWAVLREEFIDAPVLHEYACRCAEYALTFVREPDSRSIAAIEAKRKWLRGEISNDDLTAAQTAAWAAADAAACDAAWDAVRAVRAAACDAACDAWAAAWAAADAAARAAADAADAAARAAADAAALEHEVEILRELLEEGDEQ